MGEPKDIQVRAMQLADAMAVARLHRTQISQGFLSTLGDWVLGRIYCGLPQAKAGFGFVAETGGKVEAFISCATHLGKLYRGILGRQGLPIALGLLPHVIRPATVKKIVQTALYPSRVGKPAQAYPDAEILSVVCSSAVRGRGVGSRLMRRALEEFARRGCGRVKVLVGEGLQPANAYYKRNGFELAGQIEHHCRMENIYVIELEKSAGGER